MAGVDDLIPRKEGGNPGSRILCHLRNRPFGDDSSAAGTGFRPQLDKPVGLFQHIGVMVHQNHRIAVCEQIFHHAQKTLQVGGMKADGGLIQDIENAGGAVSHRPRQLHPLPLSRGQGGGAAVQGKIRKPQVLQPSRRPPERSADTLRHRAHFLRKGGGNAVHPFGELREGHLTGLIQGDAPKLRRSRCLGKPRSAAVGTDALPKELLHPLHALLILHLREGILHRVGGVEVGKVHVAGCAAGLILVNDVFLDRRSVEDYLPLLFRKLPEGHIRAHAHFSCDVLHQRPHQGLPGRNRPLVNGQGLVGNQRRLIHHPDDSGAVAPGTGALAVEGQFFCPGRIEDLPALRAGERQLCRHVERRGKVMSVGTPVGGKPREHEPEVI